VFGKKHQPKEGERVFSVKKNGEYNDFIFGVITGVEGRKVGVNGVIVPNTGQCCFGSGVQSRA
jgi:hypothetical protein